MAANLARARALIEAAARFMERPDPTLLHR
jgi:hypothetical protein